jgi:6-phosphofructokinase
MGLPLLNSSNAFDVRDEVLQNMQQKLDEVLSVAFFGYQARGALPSKFDSDYAYVSPSSA